MFKRMSFEVMALIATLKIWNMVIILEHFLRRSHTKYIEIRYNKKVISKNHVKDILGSLLYSFSGQGSCGCNSLTNVLHEC